MLNLSTQKTITELNAIKVREWREIFKLLGLDYDKEMEGLK